MSRLGDRLKELRGTLSLVDVEKGTGLSRIGVSRYEQGENVPNPPNLKKLADFYEVSYKELRKLCLEDLYSDPEELEIVLEWAEEMKNRR
ncbi:MAG: helix-turn-helix transcriptional regulator [Cyanobacteria bacterium]|nr:helix-turn-helix transcriptional regulator [Cyanobacteriota bacterium]